MNTMRRHFKIIHIQWESIVLLQKIDLIHKIYYRAHSFQIWFDDEFKNLTLEKNILHTKWNHWRSNSMIKIVRWHLVWTLDAVSRIKFNIWDTVIQNFGENSIHSRKFHLKLIFIDFHDENSINIDCDNHSITYVNAK